MDTPVVTRSLIALIVLVILAGFTAWSLYRVWRDRRVKSASIGRDIFIGVLIMALIYLLVGVFDTATLLLRALYAVASMKGSLS